jgi:predicted nucleotidyltransferase component of viral defense system
MLQHFTVETSTFKIIQEVFQVDFVSENFALAGGTSLALQIGSRISIDLDFFSPIPFETEFLDKQLNQEFENEYVLTNRSKRMLFCYIKGVKCDFVYEPAKVLEPFQKHEGIIVYSVKDIAAMKLHTICGRGKKKDFFDVYFLLEKYDWSTLLSWFIEKYNEEQQYFLYKSISYFEDAENDPDIISFPPFINDWKKIKKIILDKIH